MKALVALGSLLVSRAFNGLFSNHMPDQCTAMTKHIYRTVLSEMFSPFYYGVIVSVMDNQKQPGKRDTRLEDYFGGSGDMVDSKLPSSKAIPPEKDPAGNLSKSDKENKTFHRTPPDRKVPQVLKPSKKVAFAGLPVIVENRETEVGPKEYVEHKEVVTSEQHDQFNNNYLAQHFEPYYKLTLGRNDNIRIRRINSAAFQEDLAAIQEGLEVLDERQTCVFLWTLSASDDKILHKITDQVYIINKNEKFVRLMGVYPASKKSTSEDEAPKSYGVTLAYEFMPVSLGEVAAFREIDGPELACILKQVCASTTAHYEVLVC